MKTVSKKLLCLMLVAILLVSAVPFQASADEVGSEEAKLTVTVYNSEGKQIGEKYFSAGTYQLADLLKVCYDGQLQGYQWQGTSGKEITVTEDEPQYINLVVDPLETPEGKTVIKLKLVHNDGTSNYDTVEMYAGDFILDAIAASGIKVSRSGYKFMGWLTSHTANGADEAEYVVNRYTAATEDMTIWADWEEITDDDDDKDDVVYDAVLKIYTNGKTSSAAKTVELDAYSLDGQVTRSEVETVVKKYYKAADSDGMSLYGLFTSKTWNDGKYDTDDAVSTVKLDADNTTYIYVMVKNATAVGTDKEEEKADPSNPKTGDMIFAPMVFMVLSASALAAVYVTGKKRLVK